MKRIVSVLIATALPVAISAAPHFVTPEMTLRNGLTDAQFEALWAAGRNPRIDSSTARDWMFRASRYENTVKWFDLIGATNDFARMSLVYATNNVELVATNAVLAQTVAAQNRQINTLENQLEAAWSEANSLRIENTALSARIDKGIYEVEKTDRVYAAREESAPDEKLRTIYHEMREYLAAIKLKLQTPPNKDERQEEAAQ